MRPMNRLQPVLPVEKMQTYRVASPISTHTRPATCEEVGCPQFLRGWVTKVPIGSPEHQMMKQILSRHSPDKLRREAKDITSIGSPNAEYLFPPGTPCFKASTHRKSLDRPEMYLVRGGDWRGNTGLIRRHTRPEHWVEDSQESFDKLRRAING